MFSLLWNAFKFPLCFIPFNSVCIWIVRNMALSDSLNSPSGSSSIQEPLMWISSLLRLQLLSKFFGSRLLTVGESVIQKVRLRVLRTKFHVVVYIFRDQSASAAILGCFQAKFVGSCSSNWNCFWKRLA